MGKDKRKSQKAPRARRSLPDGTAPARGGIADDIARYLETDAGQIHLLEQLLVALTFNPSLRTRLADLLYEAATKTSAEDVTRVFALLTAAAKDVGNDDER
ncbi:MAG TPA: hypothetical protein VFS20_23200 [Longimicrobium sp.]|nr:hypothetical protein [Longimicrobium sp.]